MTNTTLVWPWPVLGPVSRNRLGKPWTVVPLYADMPVSAHWSARVRPARPTTRCGDRQLGGPEAGGHDDHVDRVLDLGAGGRAVTMPVGVTRVIGSVTTSTLSAASAG